MRALDGLFGVAIATRDRPQQVLATLDALESQPGAPFPIVVVDQSARPSPELAWRSHASDRLEHVPDEGRGLSRARNIAWRRLETEWVVFVDDDCVPDPDWAHHMADALTTHSHVDVVSGRVDENGRPSSGDYLPVTVFAVDEERIIAGRWTRPWKIGFGVCMAVRRSAIAGLDGWDERLGPGVPDFPAADDMDFNYRLLRAGGHGFVTPKPRAVHQQWRTPEELPALYRGYMQSWCGFAAKHIRLGDVAGGLWLWSLGIRDALRMLASAARRRSRLRLHIARAKIAGLAVGTVRGLTRRW